MSSEYTELTDDRSFKWYRPHLGWFDDEVELSVVVQRRRDVIRAVVQSNTTLLKEVLNSPRWYRITDVNKISLLQMAILLKNKEVFDHLLSLDHFPLEMVSKYRETPLITAILSMDEQGSDYYPYKLIEKGADIFYDRHFGFSTLSCAVFQRHILLAQLLVEKGVNLDSQDDHGNTALHNATQIGQAFTLEFVAFLLCEGANPRIKNNEGLKPFEQAVLYCRYSLLHEILFYYTYDKLTTAQIPLTIFLQLAQNESPLVHEIDDVIIDDELSSVGYVTLFDLNVKFLKVLLFDFNEKFGQVLPMCALHEWTRKTDTFEKIELMLNSNLKDAMISGIQNIHEYLFEGLVADALDPDEITEIFCYLLSYGLNVTEYVVQKVYEEYGHCELLEILLHMDIQMGTEKARQIMPCFLYDVSIDLESYLEDVGKYSTENVFVLLSYFSNQKLNQVCCQLYGKEVTDRIENLPSVPLLVELARNVFRKYFIGYFQIETSRQFYTYIKNLDICDFHRKIITFRQKLY